MFDFVLIKRIFFYKGTNGFAIIVFIINTLTPTLTLTTQNEAFSFRTSAG